jgi:hypothetical protein
VCPAGLGSLNRRTHGVLVLELALQILQQLTIMVIQLGMGFYSQDWGDGLALPTDEPMAAYGGPACRGDGSVAVAGAAIAQRVVLRSGQ